MPETSSGPNALAGFSAAPVRGPPTNTARRDHEPDREPADDLEGASLVDRRREDHEHEEERRDDLEQEALRGTDARRDRGRTAVELVVDPIVEDAAQEEGGDDCAEELEAEIDGRHRAGDPSRDPEAERDGRVEMSARDVAERADHDRDREPVREPDDDERRGLYRRQEDRSARSEKDERARPERFGDAALGDVALTHATSLQTGSDSEADRPSDVR